MGERGVRLRPPARRLRHRQLDDAAEEEPRRRRAGARAHRPRAGRAGRAPHHAEGPAARLQPRPAGGQGAALRRRAPRCAAASPCWPPCCRRCASTPTRMAAAADGLLLATDVADLLVERGVPFRRAHEMVGGARAPLPRHRHRACAISTPPRSGATRRGSTRRRPRRSRPHRSVARRRVVGGTAPAEVRRQLARAAREARA